MSRCKHCNQLTHSAHLDVEYSYKDDEKIKELTSMEGWKFHWEYLPDDINEFGILKVGDIYIHFKTRITHEN